MFTGCRREVDREGIEIPSDFFGSRRQEGVSGTGLLCSYFCEEADWSSNASLPGGFATMSPVTFAQLVRSENAQ